MRRVAVLALLLCAGLVAACGSAPARERIAAWNVPPPYLPPPDPSALTGSGPSAQATAKSAEPQATAAGEAAAGAASGAPSDAQVAADLREAFGGTRGTDVDLAAIDSGGLAIIPPTAPRRLIALMRGANEVARKPYVYGGGHGRNPEEIWSDSAYDCSGSISYALAAAGYIDGPMVSGALAGWGRPGPGKWVTIYANGGHAFMVVAGLRFDTSGRRRTGSRWQSADARSYAGFSVRHPPGL
jgi:cell wall-associated NlpC family hydrolase